MSLIKGGLWFIFFTMALWALFIWAEEWVTERLERKKMNKSLERNTQESSSPPERLILYYWGP